MDHQYKLLKDAQEQDGDAKGQSGRRFLESLLKPVWVIQIMAVYRDTLDSVRVQETFLLRLDLGKMSHTRKEKETLCKN